MGHSVGIRNMGANWKITDTSESADSLFSSKLAVGRQEKVHIFYKLE